MTVLAHADVLHSAAPQYAALAAVAVGGLLALVERRVRRRTAPKSQSEDQ